MRAQLIASRDVRRRATVLRRLADLPSELRDRRLHVATANVFKGSILRMAIVFSFGFTTETQPELGRMRSKLDKGQHCANPEPRVCPLAPKLSRSGAARSGNVDARRRAATRWVP